jgi:hypothetical protein
MKKLVSLYWQIRIVLLALRWIPNLHLGDQVKYQGRVWTLHQGVRSPVWSLANGDEVVEVHESEFSKVRSLSNYLGTFRRGYSFYRTCWFDIWVHEGIKPWMRQCRIWGRA